MAEAEARGDHSLVFTGEDARRVASALAEFRELKAAGISAYLFKRPGSAYWQLRLRNGDQVSDQSTRTTDKRVAEAIKAHKVTLAATGALPGNATFERALELLLDEARVKGLRSVGRLERASRPLLARLAGLRAKDVTHAELVKYAAARKQDGRAPDSVKFELEVARRALKHAQREGWITSVPDSPRIKDLRVRSGFFDPREWSEVRQHLRPDFRDAADFAFLTGWREMEVLALQWSQVSDGEVRLDAGTTKSGAGRRFPFAHDPRLAELIERRQAIRSRLAACAIISPWVFCFAAPLTVRGRTYEPAGAPLFKPSGDRGLRSALRAEWAAACARAGFPGRVFHDLRRSAARNFDRARIPRSVARMLGGWKSDKMYSRYDIGGDSELEAGVTLAADYVTRAGGWQFEWQSVKSSRKSRENMAEERGSRTLRQLR